MKGVDAIIHTASPVTFAADDPNGNFISLVWLILSLANIPLSIPELILPAVTGTVSVLESALKYAYVISNSNTTSFH